MPARIDRLTPMGLLEKARKSWVHIVSDEVVYGVEVPEQEACRIARGDGRLAYVEGYLRSHLWLEVIFQLSRPGKLELYVALIEASKPVHKKPLRTFHPRGDIEFRQAGNDHSMLVDVIDPGQNIKRMISFPITSLVWLHRLDISPDIFTEAIEPADEIAAFLDGDREAGEVVSLHGQRPSYLVKSGPERIGELAQSNPPRKRDILPEIRAEDIASILRVFLDADSVRLTCDEGRDFAVDGIKVFLRPLDFAEGASRWCARPDCVRRSGDVGGQGSNGLA